MLDISDRLYGRAFEHIVSKVQAYLIGSHRVSARPSYENYRSSTFVKPDAVNDKPNRWLNGKASAPAADHTSGQRPRLPSMTADARVSRALLWSTMETP